MDAVAAVSGAHAQILSAAELSVGLRTSSTTRADVWEALWTERVLVKTFGPRGTAHLLPARDLPMWTGALSAVPGRNPMPDGVRLTPEQTDEVVAAIDGALADAELTVDELTEAVVAATGSWAGDLVMPAFQGRWPRWRQAVGTAAHRGALCFGPNRGRKVTYTSPRRWLPGFRPMPSETAVAELARRYLRGYGPATPAHFARWLAAPERWAEQAFGALDLREVDVEGEVSWVLAGDEDFDHEPGGVRLLPYFDAYAVGCHPRERVFPGRAAERALARGQAGNFPVLLVGGTAAGVWHQRRSGRKVDIAVEPLGRLTAAHRSALDEQVERIGAFLEARPRLTIGAVSAGPHA
ncbi:winged helix DNA-binding domain-containing protein [Saccharopolyspora taberi]|uniref:Winged helix DNA-binding domain-containing protein n=1 Tax=Saccharopolyspora taberi TaxID=60895 RepID=A0ABN3VKH2_9PSEU